MGGAKNAKEPSVSLDSGSREQPRRRLITAGVENHHEDDAREGIIKIPDDSAAMVSPIDRMAASFRKSVYQLVFSFGAFTVMTVSPSCSVMI